MGAIASHADDKTTETHEINIEVNKGIVRLNGLVDTAREKEQATVVAKGVDGVKQVENNLIVKSDPFGRSRPVSRPLARPESPLPPPSGGSAPD